MIVVVVIAAMLLGVSAPGMQRLYQSYQYRGAVSDIVATLNAARIAAIRQGGPEDVLIYPRERKIRRGGKEQILPEALEFEVLGSAELNREGAGVIRFYENGGSSGGYVNVTHPGGRFVQVQVDWLLGRVTLCREDCREV
jgi:general secretion pathway protein H